MKHRNKYYYIVAVVSFALYFIISYGKGVSSTTREIYFFAVLYGTGMLSFIENEKMDTTLFTKALAYTIFVHFAIGIIAH